MTGDAARVARNLIAMVLRQTRCEGRRGAEEGRRCAFRGDRMSNGRRLFFGCEHVKVVLEWVVKCWSTGGDLRHVGSWLGSAEGRCRRGRRFRLSILSGTGRRVYISTTQQALKVAGSMLVHFAGGTHTELCRPYVTVTARTVFGPEKIVRPNI